MKTIVTRWDCQSDLRHVVVPIIVQKMSLLNTLCHLSGCKLAHNLRHPPACVNAVVLRATRLLTIILNWILPASCHCVINLIILYELQCHWRVSLLGWYCPARLHAFNMLLLSVSRLSITINMMISIEIFKTTNTVQIRVACVHGKLLGGRELLTLQPTYMT